METVRPKPSVKAEHCVRAFARAKRPAIFAPQLWNCSTMFRSSGNGAHTWSSPRRRGPSDFESVLRHARRTLDSRVHARKTLYSRFRGNDMEARKTLDSRFRGNDM